MLARLNRMLNTPAPFGANQGETTMHEVTLTNIDIPFSSLVSFIIKWTLASICAALVLSLPFAVLAIFVALGGH